MNADDLVNQLLHATVSIGGDFDAGCIVRDWAVDRIEQLESALTRANAATAAAYGDAGLVIANLEIGYHDGVSGDWHPYNGPHLISAGCAAIRALATPDQTAALDKLIAEAEARAVEKISELVRGWRNTIPMTGEECANAILAASKKGGAVRHDRPDPPRCCSKVRGSRNR